MPHLHETHTALDQPPRNEQLPRMRPLPVQFADVFGFAVHVKRVGRLHLHAVRQLERLDARLELRVLLPAGRVATIE